MVRARGVWSGLAMLLLLLLLFCSSSSVHAAPDKQQRTAPRRLQVRPPLFSPDIPTCYPAADSLNFTSTGCGTGCNSCTKQANPDGQRTCACCKRGFRFSTNNTVNCTPCPIGSFSRTEGSSVCTVCRTGQTNGAQGSSVCDCECVPGFILRLITARLRAGA